jgi:flagellar biosynthesis/type III secretory pathway protein FliH
MFSIFKKYKQQQRKKQVKKVFLFSTISGALSAGAALFLSRKDNRQKITKNAKKASEEIKKGSQQAYKKAAEGFEELTKRATEKGQNFFETVKGKINSNIKKTGDEEIKVVEIKEDGKDY